VSRILRGCASYTNSTSAAEVSTAAATLSLAIRNAPASLSRYASTTSLRRTRDIPANTVIAVSLVSLPVVAVLAPLVRLILPAYGLSTNIILAAAAADPPSS
jgi:hypothetical protein